SAFRKMLKEKRGVSPVVATVLLVTLAVILAAIIFLWAKSFIAENVLKNGEVVENSCDDVVFNAEIRGSELKVVNQGNVALYGVAIRKIGAGTEETCYPLENDNAPTIKSGESRGEIPLGNNVCPFSLGAEDNFKVIPVILGENDNGERKAYTCDESFGEELVYEA
ncbi:MAG: type IV pilin, partial [archaeon]|nr:type IV pilin [archaeon]